MPFTYILECRDGSFYTGSTIDLRKRLVEHQNGVGAKCTRSKLPVRLVYCEEYPHIGDAFRREKQIQKWSHVKKKALIDGKEEDLRNLAACRNITHFINAPREKRNKEVISAPLDDREENRRSSRLRSMTGKRIDGPLGSARGPVGLKDNG